MIRNIHPKDNRAELRPESWWDRTRGGCRVVNRKGSATGETLQLGGLDTQGGVRKKVVLQAE